MGIGLFLLALGAIGTAAYSNDVLRNEENAENGGIFELGSDLNFYGEINEGALFRKGCTSPSSHVSHPYSKLDISAASKLFFFNGRNGCKTGRVCRRKKGTCISSSKTCNGQIVKGCGKNCTCCIKEPDTCEITITCKQANGFCIKGSESCTGSIIPGGCTGQDCVCCVNDNNCPNGFYRVGTECFKVYQQLAGWDEARHICQEHGWDLAEPEDLTTLAEFMYNNVSHYYFWIGGRGVSGSFKYLSGHSLQDDAPWGVGYPGDKTSVGDCLILRSTNTTYTATLASYDCYSKYFFLCEPVCASGYIRMGSSCYKIVQKSMNWENAERNCYAEGATIAEPEDPKKLAEKLYYGFGGTTYRTRYWLGARGGRGINGTTIAWNSGDPVPIYYPPNNDTWYSNYPRYFTSSSCLQFYTYYHSQGPLYEYGCTSSMHSICELICPYGFFHVGNQCYKAYSKSASSWAEARETCSQAHLNLAEPQDPIAVADYLFTVTGHRNYWLGGRGNGNGFRWTSGGAISSSWDPWRPGNPGNKVTKNYCLRLAPEHRITPLISSPCDTSFYPLCQ